MSRPRWPDSTPAPDGFPRTAVTSSSDADLAIYIHRTRDRGRGVLCVLHDLAEHAGRYGRLAAVAAESGFHVYAHDHRGHGMTRAFDAPPGVFAARDGFDRVVEDAVFVNELARREHPGLPVVVFGQGFGGLVALNQALWRPDTTDGVAVWNADVDGSRLEDMRPLLALEGLLGARRGSRLVRTRLLEAWSKPFRPTRTDFDWLSRDSAAVDRYVADPACGGTTSVSLWRDVLTGVERVNEDRNFGATPRGTPFHLLAGSDDPVTGGGAAIVALDLRLRDMGFTDVSRVILGGARHDALNDLGWEDAQRILLRWVERVASERPRFL